MTVHLPCNKILYTKARTIFESLGFLNHMAGCQCQECIKFYARAQRFKRSQNDIKIDNRSNCCSYDPLEQQLCST